MKINILILLVFLGTGVTWGQSAFDVAKKLSMNRSFDSSSTILINYIDNNPQRKYDIARAWWLHSYNLFKSGLLNEALSANETSLEMRKALRSDAAAFNYLREAEIHLAANHPELAFNAANHGMELMIEDGKLYADLNFICAVAINGMGHHTEALSFAQTSLDVITIELGTTDPLYSQYLYKTALLLLPAAQYETAQSYFRQAYQHTDNWFLKWRAYLFSIANL